MITRLRGGGEHGGDITLGNLPENEKTEHEMDIAPGGMIWQTVFTDDLSEDFWNWKQSRKFKIQILEASEFQRITSLSPLPQIEVSKIVAGDPQPLLAHHDSDPALHGNEFTSAAENLYRTPPKEPVNPYQAMENRMKAPAKRKTKSKLRIFLSEKLKNLARVLRLTR